MSFSWDLLLFAHVVSEMLCMTPSPLVFSCIIKVWVLGRLSTKLWLWKDIQLCVPWKTATDKPTAGEDAEQLDPKGILLVGIWNATSLWKTAWQFFVLNKYLSYKPEVTFLGFYPRDIKTYVYIKTCTWVAVTTLFIITNYWK
jgi:hypothetical protein